MSGLNVYAAGTSRRSVNTDRLNTDPQCGPLKVTGLERNIVSIELRIHAPSWRLHAVKLEAMVP